VAIEALLEVLQQACVRVKSSMSYNMHLICTGGIHLVKDRKVDEGSDWSANDVGDVDCSELGGQEIILCRNADERDGRHETGHQGEGHRPEAHRLVGQQILFGGGLVAPGQLVVEADQGRDQQDQPEDQIVDKCERELIYHCS